MNPQPTLERVWITYLVAVCATGVLVRDDGSDGQVGMHLALHAILFAAVLAVRWVAVHRSHASARAGRTVLALFGLPAVFSAMAWLLPRVHPEPWEYVWLQWDRAVFGSDLAVLADRWLGPLCVDVLQIVYTSFYFIPIAAVISALRGRGWAAFDRALLIVVAGFLASYLGYVLVPTLSPALVLAHAAEPQGLSVTPFLRHVIDAGEANPHNCFPSGHTMLTIVSLIVAWRWNRRWCWVLLPLVLTLIASTVLLRYHWATDVVAGALLAWPAVRICDHLADRDGWPAAEPVPARSVTPGSVTLG
ncbi:MAG TPA: phosphatase PAP2 family protein [Planctomycetota bacterium]